MLYSSPMGPLFRRARLQPCDKFPIMQSSRPKLGILRAAFALVPSTGVSAILKGHSPEGLPYIIAEKINNLMENQEYYDELLNTTLADKQRFVFDGEEEMVKVVEKQ